MEPVALVSIPLTLTTTTPASCRALLFPHFYEEQSAPGEGGEENHEEEEEQTAVMMAGHFTLTEIQRIVFSLLRSEKNKI